MKKQKLIYNTLSEFSGKDLDELLSHLSNPLRNHSRRVAVCSSIMAEYAGNLMSSYDIQPWMNVPMLVHLGGTCHDIGKLLIPALLPDEAVLQQHPVLGAKLLEIYQTTIFDHQIQTDIVLDIVLYHHEQADGGGYPYGLCAKDIPVAAGLCAIADWLDKHICVQIEKDPDSSLESLFNMVEKQKGILFCKDAVHCFECAKPRLIQQYAKWNWLGTWCSTK